MELHGLRGAPRFTVAVFAWRFRQIDVRRVVYQSAKTLGRATLSSRLMSRRRQSWSTRINGSPVLPCPPFCDGDTFALSCSRDNHIAGAFSMLLTSAREKKHA